MPDLESRTRLSENIERELEEAVQDTSVLLSFLTRSTDVRLQAQFDDTKGLANRNISAPCSSYIDFLNRLSAIRARFLGTGGVDGEAKSGEPAVTDIAFLLWARDFLAAISAPATADSIRLTNAFFRHRFGGSFFGVLRRLRGIGAREDPLASLDQRYIASYASDMAHLLGRWYLYTFILSVITVAVSIYALAGHQIIDQRDKSIDQLKAVSAKIEELEIHVPNIPIVNKKFAQYLLKNESIIQSNDEKRNSIFLGPGGKEMQPLGHIHLCDNVDIVNDISSGNESKAPDHNDLPRIPSFGPIGNGAYYYYGSYEEINICIQRRRILEKLFAIGEQLMSWQRASMYLFPLRHSVPEELSGSQQICSAYAGIPESKYDQKECAKRLVEISEYYGTTSDSILGCITMYILPVLYGLIGSSVASIKYIRTRVDQYLLSFTDRSVFIQNGIFGVIAGVVVGLFASALISTTGTTAALSLSAVAFLAGYNVSGLFAFFDNISTRIFQETDGAQKSAN